MLRSDRLPVDDGGVVVPETSVEIRMILVRNRPPGINTDNYREKCSGCPVENLVITNTLKGGVKQEHNHEL